MKEKILTIKSNTQLNFCTYEMVLEGENIQMKAGQFVEVAVDGCFLRRPISVCESSKNKLTLVYKVVGEGTQKMSAMPNGINVNTLIELGNGFSVMAKTPLLIGGGIGSAPLHQLAIEFNQMGIRPTIVLGFRNKDEIFYEEKFKKLGNLLIATDDGSYGYKGNALGLIKESELQFDTYFACGPMVMMKHLAQDSACGQMSLEARMGCGFGACMGCSIMTTEGAKRVCKEGPVFATKEIIFD